VQVGNEFIHVLSSAAHVLCGSPVGMTSCMRHTLHM
jgi:hypothetical protein